MATTTTPLWVRRFHAREKTTRFVVCFSHAGGSASYFFPLSELLAGEVEVLAIQYPGRHDRHRERPFERIEDFVDPITTALEPYLEHQLAFFGHSMGALVGFEVARHLEQRGRTLAKFFASGRRAPSTWRDERPETLTDEEFITEIKKLNGASAAAFGDEDLVRMVLPTLRSDYTAAANYAVNSDSTIKSPVLVLIGDDDPKCTIAEAEAWSGHARGGFGINVLPGDHFYLDSHREEVAKMLASAFT